LNGIGLDLIGIDWTKWMAEREVRETSTGHNNGRNRRYDSVIETKKEELSRKEKERNEKRRKEKKRKGKREKKRKAKKREKKKKEEIITIIKR
jgi:hypothetical protein